MSSADSPDQGGKLGPFLAMMVVAGGMIGSGVYLLPASLAAFGSVSILGWSLAIAGAMTLGCVFSFLAVLRPSAPGLFAYVREALGPGAGFVSGVVYWTLSWVGNVPIALGVTGYLTVFFPVVGRQPLSTLVSLVVLWLFVGANLVGPKFVARLGGLSLTLGLAPVFLVAIGGWFYFHPAIFTASWNVGHQPVWRSVTSSAVIAFWGFLGVEFASVIVPVVRNPARDVPIATMGGVGFTALVYVVSSGVIMGILPASALAKSNAPFADVAAPMLGALVAGLVAGCAMFKACGALGVGILTAAESARSEAVIEYLLKPRDGPVRPRASLANFALVGLLMSLVTIASASPTLGRQFAIVANVAVVLSMAVYVAACIALFRISRDTQGPRRIMMRTCAVGGGLFACGMIGASEVDLLPSSALAVALATVAYWVLRARKMRRFAA